MLAASQFSFLTPSPLPLSGSGDSGKQDLQVTHDPLTGREEEIARMIVRGLTCESIADELQVPLRAIEGHVYRILETLGLSSIKDLTEEIVDRYRASLELRGESVGSEFLTVVEIAMSMRVSKMTVYRLIQSGELESVRFGRSYRVTHAAVQRYLDSINITGTH